MLEIMDSLSRQAAQRTRELMEERASGTPLVVYGGRFIPSELICAAGANVFPLLGSGELPPADAAQDDMLSYMNPLARAVAGGIKLGVDKITPRADIVVTSVTDIHMGRLSELLEFWGINVCKVGVPPDRQKDIAFGYYLRSLQAMLERVARITGRGPDMEEARRNFADSNRIGAAFRHINELRKRRDPPISFENYMRLQHLSFVLGDRQAAGELTALSKALDGASGVYGEGAPRLLLMGHAVVSGDYDLVRALDESGAVVSADIIDEGVRVRERDVELSGDLLENFARSRYLDTLPTGNFIPSWEERFRRALQLVEEYELDGVVWYQLAYDEVYDMEYGALARSLAERDIPILQLETSYTRSPEELARAKDKIERFVSSLKRR